MQLTHYNIPISKQKKGLENHLEEGQSLSNCILIDDRIESVKHGEEGNYLHVPYHTVWDYKQLESRPFDYDEDGKKYIPFKNLNICYEESDILNAKYINLLFSEELCTLRFCNEEQSECLEIDVCKDLEPALYHGLRYYYEEENLSLQLAGQLGTLPQEDLDNAIYSLIAKNGGKTKCIDLLSNRICYVAGVLFKALENARKGCPIPTFLFPLHFSKKAFSENYELRFLKPNASHNKEEYYHFGLEQLRKVNPAYTFIHPSIYAECNKQTSNLVSA